MDGDQERGRAAQVWLDAVTAMDLGAFADGTVDLSPEATAVRDAGVWRALDGLGLSPAAAGEAKLALMAAVDVLGVVLMQLSRPKGRDVDMVVHAVREHLAENIYTDDK